MIGVRCQSQFSVVKMFVAPERTWFLGTICGLRLGDLPRRHGAAFAQMLRRTKSTEKMLREFVSACWRV